MSNGNEEKNRDVYLAPPQKGDYMYLRGAGLPGRGAVPAPPSGGFTFGDYFHGMKPESTITKNWSKNAPAWRVAVGGLNLEGICENSACKAYRKNRVLIQWGRRNFDFFEDEHLSACPLCKKYVLPITCGFTDTQWMAVGVRKMGGGKPAEKVQGVWERARTGVYTTFDDDPAHFAQWKDLRIEIKPL